MKAAVPRVDAHQHYWDAKRDDYFWMEPDSPLSRSFLPADLGPSLERHGIAGTVVIQAAPTLDETNYLIDLAERTPTILGIVGWIDFEERLHSNTIERLVMHPKFKGVRPMIQDISDPKWMCHSNVDWAFDAIAELELCFDALVMPEHLPFLMKRLAHQRNLKAVIDHGAKPFIRDGILDPWRSQMSRLAQSTTAYVKLSGLVTEAGADWSVESLRPYVDHLIEVFGPERMIWGSGWPMCLQVSTYDRWFDTAETLLSNCSEEQKAAVFGGNAIRFYGLEPQKAWSTHS